MCPGTVGSRLRGWNQSREVTLQREEFAIVTTGFAVHAWWLVHLMGTTRQIHDDYLTKISIEQNFKERQALSPFGNKLV